MKESGPAALPVPAESPEERKRRLARERQRRHREKLRANKQRASDSTNAAASSTPPSNSDHIHHPYRSNSISRPSPHSSSVQNHRSSDPPTTSAQHAPASLHSTPPRHASTPLPRHNSLHAHTPVADPPKPLVDTTNAAVSRIDTSVLPSNQSSPPSAYAAKHAHSLSTHDHRTASHIPHHKLQLQYTPTQPLHQSLQPPHQTRHQPSHVASSAPRPAGNHLLHQPSHHHLTQQQPNPHARRMHHIPHHQTVPSHPHTPKPTPAAPTSLSQPTQQQSSLKHPHHSQLQRPYSANVHLHPPQFTHVSHAFPAHALHPHPSQQHASATESPFNFQTPANDPTLSQHAYVTDAQRSYLNDLPHREQHQYSRYHSSRIRQPPEQTDASTAINAITQSIPPTANGAHTSLPISSTASTLPTATARMPSPLNRENSANRYAHTQPSTQTLTPPLQSHGTSVARDGTHDNSQVHNPSETAEERKRRLARERQRRRRKRLKLDPQVHPNKPHVDTSSRGEESLREGAAASQNAPMDINMHVRPAADNPIQMPSSALQPALHTTFEPPNLSTNNHTTSLQPLQVAPVTATQEDIQVPATTGRNAYNSHSLTVGTSPNASNGLSSSHRAAADLARMSGASDERLIMRAGDPDEDPEARKRRLARERQRRRRQRLKEKRIVEADKAQGQQSQALKYEPTQARMVDNVESTRTHSELDRRTIPTDPITDPVRIPLTTPPANVFGPRSDVAGNMPFEQQNRLVRNAGSSGVPESTVPPMTLSFNGNNGINLGAMPVSNVMGSQNLVHWTHGFESESAARFAVEAAVGAFRSHLGGNNPSAKMYILQQGIIMLSAEEGGREVINGQILASLRTDGVMRIG